MRKLWSDNEQIQRLRRFLTPEQKRPNYGLKLPGILRFLIIALVFGAELIGVSLLVLRLRLSGFYLYMALEVLSILVVVYGLRRGRNQHYATAWIIIILALPGIGLLFYSLWGRSSHFRRSQQCLMQRRLKNRALLPDPQATFRAVAAQLDSGAKLQAHYLSSQGYALYGKTQARYYQNGESWFEQFFADLAAAKESILLAYFIIADGYIWSRVKKILCEQADRGVQIFLLYDDLGCVTKVSEDLRSSLAEHGIQVVRFNPVLRYAARLFLNYRSHQKITVIDGRIGHIGGTNLADEYANLYQPFGYWKDAALRLEGEAVQQLVATFTETWSLERPQDVFPESLFQAHPAEGSGYFIPYDDSPLNNPENPAEFAYRSLISSARQRLWIMTPYFVVDDDMINELGLAAESGVDVRLITPAHADKWYVHMVTRSNYGKLLKKGVRIYEFSPGFIHSKTVLCDDNRFICGSVNFDFRSFNLLFENACWVYDAPAIAELETDFLETFPNCHEWQFSEWCERPWLQRLLQPILKLFSPLL